MEPRVILTIAIHLTLVIFTIGQDAATGNDFLQIGEAKAVSKLTSYLKRFGYVPNYNTNPDTVKDGLRKFQEFASLNVTGKLDAATVKQMAIPRCALKDPVKLNVTLSRSRRYNHQGTTWKKNTLTWRYNKHTKDLDEQTVRNGLSAAMKKWSDVTNIEFKESTEKDVDVEINFVQNLHGDSFGFDGVGGTIAHAFYPLNNKGLSGDVHFDDAEWFTMGVDEPDGRDFMWVATHELGHTLGLDHTPVLGAIMYPWYQGYREDFDLNFDDLRGIQMLYGGKIKKTTEAPTTATTKAPTTLQTTLAITTLPPTTLPSTTSPTTTLPTTLPPTTLPPTTSPTTTLPTTLPPTTLPPTTSPPTALPSTLPPTTLPTTLPPITLPPTTLPITLPPTTLSTTLPPTTLPPTTLPTTLPPTTLPPITLPPTTLPTTLPPTTLPPTTLPPTTTTPTTLPPTTLPITLPPTTLPPTTLPTTLPPTTLPPTTLPPTTTTPTTLPPTTLAPTTLPPITKKRPPPTTPCPNSPFTAIWFLPTYKLFVFITKAQKIYFIKPNGERRAGPIPAWYYFPRSRVPGKIDAAFTSDLVFDNLLQFTIVFAGQYYYLYYRFLYVSGPHSMYDGRGPLKLNLPSYVRKIDAALTWRNGRVYLFSGIRYWKYDIIMKQLDRGYPKLIRNRWKGVDGSVTAAFRSETDRRTLLFSDNRVYLINDRVVHVEYGYPRNTGADLFYCKNAKGNFRETSGSNIKLRQMPDGEHP